MGSDCRRRTGTARVWGYASTLVVRSSWRSEDWPHRPDVSSLAVFFDPHSNMGQNPVWDHAHCCLCRSKRPDVRRNRDPRREGASTVPVEISLTHYLRARELDPYFLGQPLPDLGGQAVMHSSRT